MVTYPFGHVRLRLQLPQLLRRAPARGVVGQEGLHYAGDGVVAPARARSFASCCKQAAGASGSRVGVSAAAPAPAPRGAGRGRAGRVKGGRDGGGRRGGLAAAAAV